jgi:hypothetical protein
MKKDLERLTKKLENKEVLITNTFEENGLAYNLAHVIRTTAKKTYCIDEKYLMSNEPEGFRVIENGKVVLIKGNIETEKNKIYNIIKKLNGKVDYEIIIK